MTQPTYIDQLAAWMAKQARGRSRQSANAVAVLAIRADVKAALDAGYTLSAIYVHMKENGRIRMSFETFRTHVRKFSQTPRTGATAASSEVSSVQPVLVNPPPAIGRFDFNATPDKKDLF